MQITKREFLKRLGLLGAAGAAGAALGDEYVATNKTLPPGSVGDPDNVWFGQRIFPIGHTVEDGPSCRIENGRIVMPAREVPLFHETDVVVVGGGPAGFAAAVSAARAGAKVALVERAGSLGGLFTNGMVLVMLATSRCADGGRWEVVTRGVCKEFMDRASSLGSRCSWSPFDDDHSRGHWQPTVDPEAAKYLMDSMVAESGVEMFFHAYGVDVVQDGDKVLGVVFQSKQGLQAILAKQVVDCTGDGDIAFSAGAKYRQITHGIGFVARLANMDRITAKMPPKNAGTDIYGLKEYWATRGNEGNPSAAWASRLGPKGDGLSVRDLSAAEVAHRKYWFEHVRKMQKTPGWEEVYIANTCSQIGPRATRIFECDFVTDRAEIRRPGYSPEDSVGWFGVDGVHAAFPVSYRQLVPVGCENVLCAGRMVGAPDTIDTFRLICPCFVTGQAAGTAAALCARSGVSPRALRYSELRSALEKASVFLG
jgi:2-polyprenyl-6-methoxyphenol hydroxylase-like FAD-dependent oxidoreductase